MTDRLYRNVSHHTKHRLCLRYPPALEQDSYFGANQLNLIVSDNQTTDVGKDHRIVNLFTRASSHRNLSVIYIVQNLFHQGGSHSISLNSHSLVQFKNPRDKLQVLTLARAYLFFACIAYFFFFFNYFLVVTLRSISDSQVGVIRVGVAFIFSKLNASKIFNSLVVLSFSLRSPKS